MKSFGLRELLNIYQFFNSFGTRLMRYKDLDKGKLVTTRALGFR